MPIAPDSPRQPPPRRPSSEATILADHEKEKRRQQRPVSDKGVTRVTSSGLFAINVEETVNPYTEWTRAVPDDALIGSTWMVTASCTVDVPTTVTGTLGIAVQNAIGHGEGVLIRQEATFDGSWQVAASWLLWALGPDDGPDAQAVWLGGDPFTSIELRIRSIKQ